MDGLIMPLGGYAPQQNTVSPYYSMLNQSYSPLNQMALNGLTNSQGFSNLPNGANAGTQFNQRLPLQPPQAPMQQQFLNGIKPRGPGANNQQGIMQGFNPNPNPNQQNAQMLSQDYGQNPSFGQMTNLSAWSPQVQQMYSNASNSQIANTPGLMKYAGAPAQLQQLPGLMSYLSNPFGSFS
jgi:hypothetical protein